MSQIPLLTQVFIGWNSSETTEPWLDFPQRACLAGGSGTNDDFPCYVSGLAVSPALALSMASVAYALVTSLAPSYALTRVHAGALGGLAMPRLMSDTSPQIQSWSTAAVRQSERGGADSGVPVAPGRNYVTGVEIEVNGGLFK